MDIDNLFNFKKGWFIGNFEPSLLKTNDVEVAIKEYKKGDREDSHYHKIATEYTVILDGCVVMNGKQYQKGDIVVMYPNEETDFYSVTDSRCLVVKMPGANDDKYEGEK